MAMPFYVPPEQMMKDRADYARKSIARGREPRGVQRDRRHRDRRREPVPHAVQDQRDLRPHRVRRRRQVQRVRDAARRRRPPGRPEGLLVLPRRRERPCARQRVRPDARAGLHPRDEALRGRDPPRRGAASARRTTSCTTSSTTASSWTTRSSTVLGGQAERDRRAARDPRSTRAWTPAPRSASARACSATPTRRSPPTSSRWRCSTAARTGRAFRRITGDELDRDPRRPTIPEHIEVFADVLCPFTHVGLRRLTAQRDAIGSTTMLRVRAWPLELVNGAPPDRRPDPRGDRRAREHRCAPDLFVGFDGDIWPTTSMPALALAAAAAARGARSGGAGRASRSQRVVRTGPRTSRIRRCSPTSLPTTTLPPPDDTWRCDRRRGLGRRVARAAWRAPRTSSSASRGTSARRSRSNTSVITSR